MGSGFAAQHLGQLWIGQRGERLGYLGFADLVVIDDQPLEERLVPLGGRSAGAVANFLTRLAEDGKVRQAKRSPRAYALK